VVRKTDKPAPDAGSW